MEDEEILEMLTSKTDEVKPIKKRKVTDAKRAADSRYKKAKKKMIGIGFYPPDYELYDHVMKRAKESNTSAYIKSLIRQDMERNRQQNP